MSARSALMKYYALSPSSDAEERRKHLSTTHKPESLQLFTVLVKKALDDPKIQARPALLPYYVRDWYYGRGMFELRKECGIDCSVHTDYQRCSSCHECSGFGVKEIWDDVSKEASEVQEQLRICIGVSKLQMPKEVAKYLDILPSSVTGTIVIKTEGETDSRSDVQEVTKAAGSSQDKIMEDSQPADMAMTWTVEVSSAVNEQAGTAQREEMIIDQPAAVKVEPIENS